MHALGTPPAFVLSQDQTLRCMGWTAAEAASAPIGMDRVRVHHHDSVVKVQAAVGCGHGRIKNQGSAAVKRADTWRRLWPPGQRVSQKGRNAREPSCYVYRVCGETTAATTGRSIARAPTGVKSAGDVRRPFAPSATIPRGTALVKPVLRTVGKVLYRIQTSNDNIPATQLA